MLADDNGCIADWGTDFEAMTHPQMLNMISGANHQQVSHVGSHLTKAGTDIQSIAHDLKTHMSNLDWHSASGDAFREWGHKVASATHTLSDYATTAGTQLTNAGQVLGEVHGDMPKVPEGAAVTVAAYRQHTGQTGPHHDAAAGVPVPPGTPPPSKTQYQQAAETLSSAHLKAADNMSKLSSSYSAATEVMAAQKEPTFPPLPTKLMPPDPGGRDTSSTYHFNPDGGGAGQPSGGVREPATGGVASGGTEGSGTDGGNLSLSHLHLDGTGGTTGGTTLVADPPPTIGTPVTTTPSGPFVPPPSFSFPGDTGGEPGNQGTSRPGQRGGYGPGDDEGGPFGGAGGRSTVRTGFGAGDGIEGGRLTEPSFSGAGGRLRFSAGTVIGEEPGGLAAEPPGGFGPGGAASMVRPGEEAEFGRTGASAYGEPGGEPGMTSGRNMPGMGGLPMSGSRGIDRGRRNGHRPDWLVEEEETWAVGDASTVPSVFD